jgi:predicted DNA-binding transcriptional regulator AlpA
MSQFVTRHVLAAELGVQTQTIAKWEREGWFPQAEERISDRLILYRRTAVEQAIRTRASRRTKRQPPRRVA